jgi:hypothetical protein
MAIDAVFFIIKKKQLSNTGSGVDQQTVIQISMTNVDYIHDALQITTTIQIFRYRKLTSPPFMSRAKEPGIFL